MFKDLFLIRHAESSHPPNVNDFDRPLSETGHREAHIMSLTLKQYKRALSGLLISSPAKRALDTAKIFTKTFNRSVHLIQPENMIYEATVSSLLSIINHLPEDKNEVVLFGHNPGISELAGYLSESTIGSMPTAGIIHIQFSIDSWKLVSKGLGEIKWEVRPNL